MLREQGITIEKYIFIKQSQSLSSSSTIIWVSWSMCPGPKQFVCRSQAQDEDQLHEVVWWSNSTKSYWQLIFSFFKHCGEWVGK